MTVLFRADESDLMIYAEDGILHVDSGNGCDEITDTKENRLAVMTEMHETVKEWYYDSFSTKYEDDMYDLLETIRFIDCIDCEYYWDPETDQYELWDPEGIAELWKTEYTKEEALDMAYMPDEAWIDADHAEQLERAIEEIF